MKLRGHQIINKVEKENFGLKLKIHFLEESLRKAGPGFHEAALRENTDLKVDKITIQKELARCRKSLTQAEQDVEAYKRHVEEVQEQAKKKHADANLRKELEDLKSSLAAKWSEVDELRQQLEAAENRHDDAQKLKEDIEDLEADLRQKDHLVDERDDEIERLKSQGKNNDDEFEQVCSDLDTAKERIQSLEREGNTAVEQEQKLQDLQKELDDALQAKQKAEENLDEVSARSMT